MNEYVLFYNVLIIALLVFQYYRYKKKVEQIKSSLEFETSELMPEYHKKTRKYIFILIGSALATSLIMASLLIYLQIDEKIRILILCGVTISLSLAMGVWMNKQKKKYLVKKMIILTEKQREDILAKYKQNYIKSAILLIIMSICLGFTNLK